MLNERKILRFEPVFIDILNQHVCHHIGYSPGRCFAVMLSLFCDLPKQAQQHWLALAKQTSKHYKTHNSYYLKPVQIRISKKLSRIFTHNDDRIVIIAVLLYHNVLVQKEVGV